MSDAGLGEAVVTGRLLGPLVATPDDRERVVELVTADRHTATVDTLARLLCGAIRSELRAAGFGDSRAVRFERAALARELTERDGTLAADTRAGVTTLAGSVAAVAGIETEGARAALTGPVARGLETAAREASAELADTALAESVRHRTGVDPVVELERVSVGELAEDATDASGGPDPPSDEPPRVGTGPTDPTVGGHERTTTTEGDRWRGDGTYLVAPATGSTLDRVATLVADRERPFVPRAESDSTADPSARLDTRFDSGSGVIVTGRTGAGTSRWLAEWVAARSPERFDHVVVLKAAFREPMRVDVLCGERFTGDTLLVVDEVGRRPRAFAAAVRQLGRQLARDGHAVAVAAAATTDTPPGAAVPTTVSEQFADDESSHPSGPDPDQPNGVIADDDPAADVSRLIETVPLPGTPRQRRLSPLRAAPARRLIETTLSAGGLPASDAAVDRLVERYVSKNLTPAFVVGLARYGDGSMSADDLRTVPSGAVDLWTERLPDGKRLRALRTVAALSTLRIPATERLVRRLGRSMSGGPADRLGKAIESTFDDTDETPASTFDDTDETPASTFDDTDETPASTPEDFGHTLDSLVADGWLHSVDRPDLAGSVYALHDCQRAAVGVAVEEAVDALAKLLDPLFRAPAESSDAAAWGAFGDTFDGGDTPHTASVSAPRRPTLRTPGPAADAELLASLRALTDAHRGDRDRPRRPRDDWIARERLATAAQTVGRPSLACRQYGILTATSADPVVLWRLGDLLDAPSVGIDEYLSAVVERPSVSTANYLLGVLREARDEPELALARYRLATVIDPSFAPAQYNCGHLLAEEGTREAAIDRFERAAAADPGDPAIHLALGRHRRELGDTAGAVTSYRRAVAVEPHAPSAQYNLAAILADQGVYDEARDAASEAVRLWLRTGELGNALTDLQLLLSVCQVTGDHETALRYARRVRTAIEINGQEPPESLVSVIDTIEQRID